MMSLNSPRGHFFIFILLLLIIIIVIIMYLIRQIEIEREGTERDMEREMCRPASLFLKLPSADKNPGLSLMVRFGLKWLCHCIAPWHFVFLIQTMWEFPNLDLTRQVIHFYFCYFQKTEIMKKKKLVTSKTENYYTFVCTVAQCKIACSLGRQIFK